MFEEEYKNQIEPVKPDGYIKNKIRARLNGEPPENKVKFDRRRVFARGICAAALCVALICSVFVLKLGRKPIPSTSEPTVELQTAQNYSEIYDKISEMSNSRNYSYGIVEDATGGATKGEGSPTQENSQNGTASPSQNHSETTTQVDGVDEADIIKTDGHYIYSLYLRNNVVRVIKVDGDSPQQLASIELEKNASAYSMYLINDRLVVIEQDYIDNVTKAQIFDISDPQNPKEQEKIKQSGQVSDTRLIGNKLYVITNYCIYSDNIKKEQPETYVPNVSCKDFNSTVDLRSISFCGEQNYPVYTVICAFDITDSKLCGTCSMFGGNNTVYCNKSNLVIATDKIDMNTDITSISINDGEIQLSATGTIKGKLLNQFSIDEYNGYFRFVTTNYAYAGTKNTNTGNAGNTMTNSLIILDNKLKQVGVIENISPDEKVYSVRFMGDTAYFVTFRQTDPLFSVDLSNPEKPEILGALKIPGFSNYLFPYGDGKLLGIGRQADENSGAAQNIKLSMFDISNPANVTENSKTEINAKYSEALYNHKACIVDKIKNLIAFSAYGDTGNKYFICAYEDGKFVVKAELNIAINSYDTRGVYSGNYFYIVTEQEIKKLDMNNFSVVDTLALK